MCYYESNSIEWSSPARSVPNEVPNWRSDFHAWEQFLGELLGFYILTLTYVRNKQITGKLFSILVICLIYLTIQSMQGGNLPKYLQNYV